MTKLITGGSNLQGAVPPSEAVGQQYQMEMILDAIKYHEEGDEDDAPCCTGDNPCQTRIFLVGQQRALAGKVIGQREVTIEKAVQERKETSSQVSRGRVADPASEAQIRYVKRLNMEHDASGIGTFPRRTLDAILADLEVSKGRASRLIEALMRQPKAEIEPIEEIPAAGPAPSDSQIRFLRVLSTDAGEDEPKVRTKQEASDEIERLIAIRDATKSGSKAAEEGMYRIPDGTIYRVQIAKQGSGRPYAKKLVEDADGWHFRRVAGMQFRLKASDKLSLDEAKEWGKLYGVCCKCGADLTDETSIAEGIGPICGDRW